MSSQKDIKDRIQSTKNIRKVTRAMEMVAAARLRKAEQRIEELRPYARALRRLTQQAADAAGKISGVPVLEEREETGTVGLLLLTGDRGLAGPFNSQILKAGDDRAADIKSDGASVRYYAVGKRGVSSLDFRGVDVAQTYTGFTDRPTFTNAHDVGQDLVAAYVDGKVDQVDMIYNRYESAMTQYVRRQTLLPLQRAAVFGDDISEEPDDEEDDSELEAAHKRAQWEYEPEPEKLLEPLTEQYVDLMIYRAMLESTASEHGARMTAMRSAADNAEELIEDLDMEMNRARQQEITQQILEIVAGAEALEG
ncbi:MAG: ATP synthase F1 subunit gamma [Solirubrobacterales bacterium]